MILGFLLQRLHSIAAKKLLSAALAYLDFTDTALCCRSASPGHSVYTDLDLNPHCRLRDGAALTPPSPLYLCLYSW